MEFICGLLVGIFMGDILGVISYNKSEGTKAKKGKCTMFDGEIYRYVKIENKEE